MIEIGGGTGASLPGYRPAVTSLTVTEPEAAHCNGNRPTLGTIGAAGFTITGLERSELREAPPFVRPLVIGTATAAGPGHQGAGTAATRSA